MKQVFVRNQNTGVLSLIDQMDCLFFDMSWKLDHCLIYSSI